MAFPLDLVVQDVPKFSDTFYQQWKNFQIFKCSQIFRAVNDISKVFFAWIQWSTYNLVRPRHNYEDVWSFTIFWRGKARYVSSFHESGSKEIHNKTKAHNTMIVLLPQYNFTMSTELSIPRISWQSSSSGKSEASSQQKQRVANFVDRSPITSLCTVERDLAIPQNSIQQIIINRLSTLPYEINLVQ